MLFFSIYIMSDYVYIALVPYHMIQAFSRFDASRRGEGTSFLAIKKKKHKRRTVVGRGEREREDREPAV